MGVGFDRVDVAAATELGILASITPGTIEPAVAEWTLGHILAVRRRLFRTARQATGRQRAEPDFMVIGAQKSGTSSLFSYLIQHPQILRPVFKEPYFFDRHYHRGLGWYGCIVQEPASQK